MRTREFNFLRNVTSLVKSKKASSVHRRSKMSTPSFAKNIPPQSTSSLDSRPAQKVLYLRRLAASRGAGTDQTTQAVRGGGPAPHRSGQKKPPSSLQSVFSFQIHLAQDAAGPITACMDVMKICKYKLLFPLDRSMAHDQLIGSYRTNERMKVGRMELAGVGYAYGP